MGLLNPILFRQGTDYPWSYVGALKRQDKYACLAYATQYLLADDIRHMILVFHGYLQDILCRALFL